MQRVQPAALCGRFSRIFSLFRWVVVFPVGAGVLAGRISPATAITTVAAGYNLARLGRKPIGKFGAASRRLHRTASSEESNLSHCRRRPAPRMPRRRGGRGTRAPK
eukprot:scaffold122355_cov17-Tisochrysis_lutea.AAC.1